MAITHETHTIAELEAARAKLRAELARLTREHGTWYHSAAINKISVNIGCLNYEISCAQALARSGFAIGDRVYVGPPYQPFSAAAGLGPEYGHDSITGRIGHVRRITAQGDDLLLALDDGTECFAPVSRCSAW